MERDPDALQPVPTVAGWQEMLSATGTVELSAFTAFELAAVGAGSPLRGLVADESFLATGDEDLHRELARARAGLQARGLAGTAVPGPDGVIDFGLGGDLAAIVAVRRQPALLATVSVAHPGTLDTPGPGGPAQPLLAVLHGVAAAGTGLFALLEETTTATGLHLFALSDPGSQARRISEALEEMDDDEGDALSVHVYRPDPAGGRHLQMVLTSGQARLSGDGMAWQQVAAAADWPLLFEAALTA